MFVDFLRRHPLLSTLIGFMVLSVVASPFLPDSDAPAEAVAVEVLPDPAGLQLPSVDLEKLQDAYLVGLAGGGFDASLVTGVQALDVRTVQVVVSDAWHYEPKQVRLQLAQRMWAAWALVASPDNSDLARIKLVDQLGNSVGGSGWLGGSLVSVND